MAWLSTTRRKDPSTGRARAYYSVGWRERGVVFTKSLGFVPPKEARRALKIVEGRLALGMSPRQEEPPSSEPSSERVPTVAEYLDEVFLPVVRRDKSDATWKNARTCAGSVRRLLGELSLDEVSYQQVDRFITRRRREGVRTRTVQLEVRLLRNALGHAHKCRLISARPELPVVKVTDAKPHRWLSAEESERLLAAARPPEVQPEVTRGRPPRQYDALSYLAISMALNLGMRRGEILSRGWEDLRWAGGVCGVLVIARKPAANFEVKTRRSRAIPLTPELADLLRAEHHARGRPATGWIFPSPRDPSKPRATFINALKAACARAGLEPIHPHGLRHSWASRLALAGVDRRTLMELGGWRDGRMLDEIYAHVSDDHVAEVMSRMGVGPAGEAR